MAWRCPPASTASSGWPTTACCATASTCRSPAATPRSAPSCSKCCAPCPPPPWTTSSCGATRAATSSRRACVLPCTSFPPETMKTSPGLRWAAYAIAAAATAAAMWHVDHRDSDVSGDAVQALRPAQRGLALPVSATRPAANDDALSILKHRLDAAMNGSADPFSDSQPAAAAAAAAVRAQAAAAPVEAAPPAMPFTYVGRWQEQGKTQVFLRTGDRVLAVSGPGPLEGAYAVEALGADSLRLKMPDGQTQVISFAAPAPAASGAPAAGVQTTASTPTESTEEN